MRHWLCVTTNDNWELCNLRKTWGVTDRFSETLEQADVGDELWIYIKGWKCAGRCVVSSPYFYSKERIWPGHELYPHRIKFEEADVYPEPQDIAEFIHTHVPLKKGQSRRTYGNYFRRMFQKMDSRWYRLFASFLKATPPNKQFTVYPLFQSSGKGTVTISRGSILSTSTIDQSATWGMNQAESYEKQQGRIPHDVSAEIRGYDIESDSITEVRYIEVKARRGHVPVTLTENEYMTARKLQSHYYLYVMTEDGKGTAVENPAKVCSFRPRWTLVWEVTDWATKGKSFHFKPKRGMKQ